ncbi:GntR family transcriptional regulator [[Erwinia] mediterraneensis]|uniref:GntR family transcriptional regulator n=1 Tax=[Erwinia] mediterraneensis TaxID=2161819 RepID=UPI0010306F6A|nr:GntR family transcriptional regulator [[Erwinia] mediterraneensis]
MTMARSGKLERIVQQLEQRIRSGYYSQGERLPTEINLCTDFAVSRPTLSRALARLRAQGLIRSTQGSGHYVTFAEHTAPASAADPLTLGILSPRMEANESGFLFEQIFKSIAALSQSFNFDLVWNGVMTLGAGATRQAIISKIDHVIERYVRSSVKGVFFIPVEFHPSAGAINELILSQLDRYGIGVVLLDSDVARWPARSRWDLIGIDNVAAGMEVTRHLLQQQPRRIDFLCERFSANTVNMRRMGYRLALLEAGLTPCAAWEHEGELQDTTFVQHLLASGMQDIVCANDFTAMKLLAVCAQQGIRVNVVGFDDNAYSALLGIPLTTYKQPFSDIARNAVLTLLNRLQYPQDSACHLTSPGELIVRASCGVRLPTC